MKTMKEKRVRIILINALVVWVLFSVAAYFVDGFVLHNISAQNGEITDLSKTNTGYSNSMVVDTENYPQNGQVFLVEKDEQLHVLYFKNHFTTGRYILKSDTIVQTDGTQKIVVDDGIENVVITIEDKSIANGTMTYFAAADNGFVYMAIALLLTAFETAILWFFLKKRDRRKFCVIDAM